MDKTDAQDISSTFIKSLMLIHRNFYRHMTAPIPLNQFATLMALRLESPCTPKTLCNTLSISKQQMTAICDKLEQGGCILRHRDPKDHRRILISITKKGQKILSDQNEIVRQKFLRSLISLSDEEQKKLDEALHLLNASINKMRPLDED